MTKENIIKKIKNGQGMLVQLTEDQANDKDFLLEIIKLDGFMYNLASKSMQYDKKICVEAIKSQISMIKIIPFELFGNAKFTNRLVEAARTWCEKDLEKRKTLKDKFLTYQAAVDFKRDFFDKVREYEYYNLYKKNQEIQKSPISSSEKQLREIAGITQKIENTFNSMKRDR